MYLILILFILFIGVYLYGKYKADTGVIVPIKTKDTNVVAAKDSKDYNPLPLHMLPSDDHGQMIITFKFSLWQRLVILFRGRMWGNVMTFDKDLQPMLFKTYNFTQELYLPLDEVVIPTNEGTYHSRLFIGQRVDHSKMGWGEIVGFAGYDEIIIRLDLGNPKEPTRIHKYECFYRLEDIKENTIEFKPNKIKTNGKII